MNTDIPTKSSSFRNEEDKLTIYVLTLDFSGLHEMFETENWDTIAGVPLVPLYWLKLAEKGHRVHVFVWGKFKSEKDFTLEGIHFHRRRIAGWTLSDPRGFMAYLKIAWFLLQLKSFRLVCKVSRIAPPNVIYSYCTTFIPISHFLSRLMGIPHIAHIWGTWLGHYLFKEPWYKRLRCLGAILALKFPIDLLIISNDGTFGDRVVEKLKFPKERFRFWLDGTMPGIYQSDIDKAEIKGWVGLEGSDKMIFQAVRLAFWKRVDRAIAAMPVIVERVPNARLVIAGDGNLRADLEEQARMLGVSDYVKFLGFVPHEQVLKLHNAADLFVTVQDLTNLGNQTLEALHSGTCTVAYNIGGISEVMVNEVTGVLLEQDQLHNLGDIIADLLLDDEKRHRLAHSALSFAREKIWTWNKRIDAEIAEVKRLVTQKRQKIR